MALCVFSLCSAIMMLINNLCLINDLSAPPPPVFSLSAFSLCYGPMHTMDGRHWSAKPMKMHDCSTAIKFQLGNKWFVLLLVVMPLLDRLWSRHLDFM